eukprot:1135747-Heterocapsa_arctica.AAC.1
MEDPRPMPSILIVYSPPASPRGSMPHWPHSCPLAAPSGLNGGLASNSAVPADSSRPEPLTLPRPRFRFRVVDSDEDS